MRSTKQIQQYLLTFKDPGDEQNSNAFFVRNIHLSHWVTVRFPEWIFSSYVAMTLTLLNMFSFAIYREGNLMWKNLSTILEYLHTKRAK